MTTTIQFGYGDEWTLPDQFDLNVIRHLRKVETVGDKRLIKTGATQITLYTNVDLSVTEEEKDTAKLEDATMRADRNYRWYEEEKAKTKKIQDELLCLKAQFAELTGEKDKL